MVCRHTSRLLEGREVLGVGLDSGGLGDIQDGDVALEGGVGLVVQVQDPEAVGLGDDLRAGQALPAGAAVLEHPVQVQDVRVELVLDLQQGVSAITRDFRRSARGPWPCDRCV